MNATPHRLFLLAGAAVAVCAAGAAAWGGSTTLGVAAGGAWNLASLWCLAQLLGAWLGPQPSRRRALLWLFMKFPLLYAAVFALLRLPGISAAGFGIGFTLVLVGAIAWLTVHAQRLAGSRSYGR